MKTNLLLWIYVILLSLAIMASTAAIVMCFSILTIILYGAIIAVCGIGIYEIIKIINQ